ncbi:MAG: hypothetical protein AAF732_20255 [Pseudomonadota bacterium]
MVMHQGREVGHILQIEQGANEGKWTWSCYWLGGGNGVAETRREALAAIGDKLFNDIFK